MEAEIHPATAVTWVAGLASGNLGVILLLPRNFCFSFRSFVVAPLKTNVASSPLPSISSPARLAMPRYSSRVSSCSPIRTRMPAYFNKIALRIGRHFLPLPLRRTREDACPLPCDTAQDVKNGHLCRLELAAYQTWTSYSLLI